jgi:hypothetical protein
MVETAPPPFTSSYVVLVVIRILLFREVNLLMELIIPRQLCDNYSKPGNQFSMRVHVSQLCVQVYHSVGKENNVRCILVIFVEVLYCNEVGSRKHCLL